MDDTKFDADLEKLQKAYDKAIEKNDNKWYFGAGCKNISYNEYQRNQKDILVEFKKAKHRLYEKRAEAKIAERDRIKIPGEEMGPPPYGASSFTESPADDVQNVATSLDSIDENASPGHYCWTAARIFRALAIGAFIGMFIGMFIRIIVKKKEIT